MSQTPLLDRDWKSLELEKRGTTLHVWLNRPARLNAISPVMLRELGDLYSALETDFETRVVVLGGRGRLLLCRVVRGQETPSSLLATGDVSAVHATTTTIPIPRDV